MTILVIGASGQVAQELSRIGTSIVTLGRSNGFDLTDLESSQKYITGFAPRAVINASAYTKVDQAETDYASAYALNVDGPIMCAKVCRELDIPFIHVSTDFVFSGTKSTPYLETDEVAPKSVYGDTKARGEAGVTRVGGKSTIIRTSWVYSAFGQNFVKTMLKLAETRPEIRVVADQVGSPTWASDLAGACLAAATKDHEAGIYHFSGSGTTSWAGLASAVFANAALHGLPTAEVLPIPTSQYPTPASRPAYSVLSNSKFAEAFGSSSQPWEEALGKCVAELAQAGANVPETGQKQAQN